MPLSRTRSLLANINTSTATTAQPPDTASYSSHFSDTQVNVAPDCNLVNICYTLH